MITFPENAKMNVVTSDWERSLLSMALERNRDVSSFPKIASLSDPSLGKAYDYCDELTARNSKSFYLASRLLPPKKRKAIRALYAFCRISDDIVDRPSSNAKKDLASWRRKVFSAHPSRADLAAFAWANACSIYNIPQVYAEQLLDGVEADLTKTRYANFDELADYAYRVASTVGLMSMHIIGYSSDEAIPYAIKMGIALQITNILRDVGEDLRAGRIYLPQDELTTFGISEGDLVAGKVSERWQKFMQFQIARNRRLYQEAWPGIALLHPEGRLSIAAAARFYAAVLDDIEANDYDVFNRRAYTTTWEKLRKLPLMWFETRKLSR